MAKNSSSKLKFKDISSISELRQAKRVLSSRIEHQEMMMQYQFRVFRQHLSPGRLFLIGLEAVSSKSSFISTLLQTFNAFRAYFYRKNKKV